MDGEIGEDPSLSILYVDDEELLLDVGKLYIEKYGHFKVTTTDNAEDGLSKLNKESFDCIISDYQMPDMDGIEFLQRVRKTDQNTPFIIFTGKGRDGVENIALDSGADFYVRKGGDVVMQYKDLIHKVRCSVSARKSGADCRDTDQYFRDFIYVYDINKGFKSVSGYFCELFGMSKDEIIGKSYRELGFPEDTCEYLYGLHEDVYRTKDMMSAVSSIKMHGGIKNQCKVVFVPVFDGEGSVVGVGSKGEVIVHNVGD